MRDHWTLDPSVCFLNHGSFGACPRPVLEAQQRLRDRLERQPVQFYVRDLEPMLDEARSTLARFVGAAACDLAWVPNATTGVNAVLRSLRFGPDDELIVTDHEYGATRNTLDFAAGLGGSRVVVVPIPFPLTSPDEIVERIADAAGPRTRLAVVDHVTSQTGLVLPIERIAAELSARGVELLVDGAHAPGMLDLVVEKTGATYYAGNCHKWICAPKGAGFLWVRRDRQADVRPVTISHGATVSRSDRSRFLVEFDWVGTTDPTAALSVPVALETIGSLLDGGWPSVRAHNRALALEARKTICAALEIEPPCPDEMIGSLAAFPLPPGSDEPPRSPLYADPLQAELLERWSIEVPVIPWPAPPSRVLRISAQLYNRREEYERLAASLHSLFRDGPSSP